MQEVEDRYTMSKQSEAVMSLVSPMAAPAAAERAVKEEEEEEEVEWYTARKQPEVFLSPVANTSPVNNRYSGGSNAGGGWDRGSVAESCTMSKQFEAAGGLDAEMMELIAAELGPGNYCSPRHMIPFISGDEGLECVE